MTTGAPGLATTAATCQCLKGAIVCHVADIAGEREVRVDHQRRIKIVIDLRGNTHLGMPPLATSCCVMRVLSWAET